MDGKTEYMGQLVDPMAMTKKEGVEGENLKVELQWTHNGLYEWVSVDRVRVELSPMGQRPRGTAESWSPPETNNKKRRAPSSPEKEENLEPQKERISPEKVLPEGGKSDVLEKGENDTSNEKAQDPEVTSYGDVKEDKNVDDKVAAEDVKEATTEDSGNKESEATREEPPAKKRKIESGPTTSGGFFASLSQQVVDAKNAFVTGFQEIYKELLGPQ